MSKEFTAPQNCMDALARLGSDIAESRVWLLLDYMPYDYTATLREAGIENVWDYFAQIDLSRMYYPDRAARVLKYTEPVADRELKIFLEKKELQLVQQLAECFTASMQEQKEMAGYLPEWERKRFLPTYFFAKCACLEGSPFGMRLPGRKRAAVYIHGTSLRKEIFSLECNADAWLAIRLAAKVAAQGSGLGFASGPTEQHKFLRMKV